EAVLAPRRGVRGVLGVHRRAGRPSDRLPRADRAAREHRGVLRRGQRRLGRRQPERLGQREQVLQRLPRHGRGEHEVHRPARRAGHLRALPDRVGGGVLDAVPDVQALRAVLGRHQRPAGDLLAEGHQGARRDQEPVPPFGRHRPDHPRHSGPGDAKIYKGVDQYPLAGVSMRYTFDAKPDDPTKKKRQYYAMLGTRGMWEDGWLAASVHAPISGKGHFDKDAWQLYHTDVDRSESKDLAKENPDKLQALITAWFEEADRNNVLPLDDRTSPEQLNIDRPSDEPARERYIYYPDTASVPESISANIRNRSYKVLSDIVIDEANAA